MKRIVTGVLWVSLMACGAASVLACGDEFGDCQGRSGKEAFDAQRMKLATVAGLTTAFRTADKGESNGKFNGVQDTIERIQNEFEKNAADTADTVDDNREPERGATQGQVDDMKRAFQGVIDYIAERKQYFRDKKAELDGIDLGPMSDDYKNKISDMKRKLNDFIEKFEGGTEKMTAAKNAIRVGKKEDECKHEADEIKRFREEDLQDARDALNDTIEPVKKKREDAISDLQDFTCRCSTTVSQYQFEQQQAQITQLQEDNERLRAALEQQGIQVEPQTQQGSIDETDTGAPGAPRAPTDAQPASAGSQPPAGADAPRGRALTQEEAQGGLGAIAFANCERMGYECTAAAIYGPGGMVEVLARNITNRDVTNPNLINAGDTIDFEAVDAANN